VADESGADAFAKRVGTRITKRREELGLSLAELAKVTGIAEADLVAIESGDVALGAYQLPVFAKALSLSVTDLIG